MFAVVNEGHVSGLKGGAGATQLQLLPSGNVDLVLLHDSLFQEKLDIWLLDEISSLKCWQLIKKKMKKQNKKKPPCGPNQTCLQAGSGQRPPIYSV